MSLFCSFRDNYHCSARRKGVTVTLRTRSHPEMVGDMSRVTLNFDLSKISFVHF